MIRRGALRSSTAFLWKTPPSVHNYLVRLRVGVRVGGREMNSAPGFGIHTSSACRDFIVDNCLWKARPHVNEPIPMSAYDVP